MRANPTTAALRLTPRLFSDPHTWILLFCVRFAGQALTGPGTGLGTESVLNWSSLNRSDPNPQGEGGTYRQGLGDSP